MRFSRKKITFFGARSGVFVVDFRKKHIGGFLSLASAIFAVEDHVIFWNIIAFGEAEYLRGSIDGLRRTFQLQKDADGCLIYFD